MKIIAKNRNKCYLTLYLLINIQLMVKMNLLKEDQAFTHCKKLNKAVWRLKT